MWTDLLVDTWDLLRGDTWDLLRGDSAVPASLVTRGEPGFDVLSILPTFHLILNIQMSTISLHTAKKSI